MALNDVWPGRYVFLVGVPVLAAVLGFQHGNWPLDIVLIVAAIAADLVIWRTGSRSLWLDGDVLVLRTWRGQTRLPLDQVTDVRQQYVYEYGRPLYLRGPDGLVVDIVNVGNRSKELRHSVGARLRELHCPGLSHATLATLRVLGLD